MDENEDLEQQSFTNLDKIGKKTEKVLEIIQNQVDKHKRLGKLKRDEDYLNSLNAIKMFLMWAFAVFIAVFLIAIFVCGLWPIEFRGNGIVALEKVFIEVAENFKAVILIALGFFFRGYLPSYNEKDDR